jgi:mono/diheme cytochrome c family protein
MKDFVVLVVLTFLVLGVVTISPNFWQSDKSIARAQPEVKLGERIYRENCAACHGERGDGKGPQAEKLKTKPRDFTSGVYKFRSTPSGSLPLDSDLMRTITRGIRGTSMLAQLHLSKQETSVVVQYLKSFSPRFKNEKSLQAIAIPRKPPATSSLISVGKSKYEEAGCAQCHGAKGKGDGPSGEISKTIGAIQSRRQT